MQYTVVHSTWLSQKPARWAFVISASVALIIALFSWIYWQDLGLASQWMPATQNSVWNQHLFWQAWTALFAHADFKHLLSNMFLFFIFGSFLNGYFGLWMFPFMAFVFGGITNLLVLRGMQPETQLLGASGVVFWMGGAWLSLYFLLDEKRSYYQRGLRALGVAILLFFPAEAFDPHISYSSHFWGFILGLVFGISFYYYHRAKFRSHVVSELVTEVFEESHYLDTPQTDPRPL